MNKILNAITCKEPKRLIKPVLWNTLANLSNLLPFLCLAYIVNQIYEYFIHGTVNSKPYISVDRLGPHAGLLWHHMFF